MSPFAFSRLRVTPINGDGLERSRRAELDRSLSVDPDLKYLEGRVNERCRHPFAAEGVHDDLDGGKLPELVELLRDVAKTEFDRETNLNTRAATVAVVAGLIVTASAAVGKSVFTPPENGEAVPFGTVASFIIGLCFIVAAMVMVVLGVLRPKQAPTRHMFFSDTLIALWSERGRRSVIVAEPKRLNILFVDRLLRTIALWSVRNRQKARWLRRGWLFLGLGVLLIAVAGLLVLPNVTPWSLLELMGVVAVGLVLVGLVLILESLHIRESRQYSRAELDAIAVRISGPAEPLSWFWSAPGSDRP